jgi:hypothetical protein
MEMFLLRRLEVYTQPTVTAELTYIIVQIVVEVTSILGIATKEVKQGRMGKYLLYNTDTSPLTGRSSEKCAKKLIGRREIEIDKLIHEEASDRTIAFNSAMSGTILFLRDMSLNTGSPMSSTRKCHHAYERRWNTCLT